MLPKCRSIIRNTRATVITGKASSSRIWVIRLIQQNIGIRRSRICGALKFTMVTKKLSAAAMEATPRICRPSSQKSVLSPGEGAAAVACSTLLEVRLA